MSGCRCRFGLRGQEWGDVAKRERSNVRYSVWCYFQFHVKARWVKPSAAVSSMVEDRERPSTQGASVSLVVASV